jgi:hypothetical protein
MAMVNQAGVPVNLSASGSVCVNPCQVIGFYVNSTSGGTLVFRDGGAAGTAVSGTITPLAGFNTFPASMSTGCYVTISGTINVTVFVQT